MCSAHTMAHHSYWNWILPLSVILLGSCGNVQHDSKPVIAATIPPLADLIQQIAGDRLAVECLLDAGQDPHGFEPSPSQMARLANSHSIVMVGYGLDNWAADSVGAVTERDARILVLAPKLIPAEEESHNTDSPTEAHADEEGHAPHNIDPHFWLDPQLMIQAAALITEELISLDPDGTATYRQNSAEMVAKLNQLDVELAERFAPLKGLAFIGQHGAYSWFAARYGMNQIGVIEDWPGKTATPKQLSQLIETAQATGAKAIFTERQRNRRVAENTVARELGIPVIILDPMGGSGAAGNGDYISVMRWNSEQICAALMPESVTGQP